MKTTYNLCNNCGKQGHLFQDCKMPIISIGIILFRKNNRGFEYLMIRRKDSFGFSDFLRGKYAIYNKNYITNIVDEMTIDEKERILNKDFLDNSKKINDENLYKKWTSLYDGIVIDDTLIKIENIINNSKTNWLEPEWGFPKGRRDYQEKDIECAIREFEEETGYSKSHIKIIENVIPYEEIFFGSNYKAYKHKYYLAHMQENIDILNKYQKSEVSKLEWKTYDECINSIRPYNSEKKLMLEKINIAVNDFLIF
jgi:ADP-ribose pyrophosphatase YjhB (NUDIX family)